MAISSIPIVDSASSMNPPTIAIKSPAEIDAHEWNTFITSNTAGSFYHLHEWAEINRSTLGRTSDYIVALQGTHICGALPLVTMNSRLFGRILCSMPFVNFGGPISNDMATQHLLLNAAQQLSHDRRVDYMELRCIQPLETDIPVALHKVSMTIDLAPDSDVLWNKFTSKHRTNIRRVYKNGLEVTAGGLELLPQFYRLLELSWHNLGTPLYRYGYFEAILKTFPEMTRIFLCHQAGKPVATALNGYFNGTVEGMWAAGDPEARNLQANYVLYWEMIQEACKRGYRRYHLGRSTADSGAEQFKSKWNATSHQLYWYFHRPDGGPLPKLNVNNPKYRLAIAVWQRLPMWATRALGARIAPLIP